MIVLKRIEFYIRSLQENSRLFNVKDGYRLRMSYRHSLEKGE